MGTEVERMIEWNTVKYIDCMDPNEGLPSLPDQSIDLGFTDPPWLIGYKGFDRRKKGLNENEVIYKDDYPLEWNLLWLNELLRICHGIIIIMGRVQLKWWVKNTDYLDIGFVYFKNGTGQSKISQWNCYSPYLFFGDYFRTHKCFHNVWRCTIPNGFLSKETFIHPNRKGIEIPLKLLKDLKPESIIDPFAGSGSYLKAADILGIPWIGYEINEVYSHDIDKRFSKRMITEWIR